VWTTRDQSVVLGRYHAADATPASQRIPAAGSTKVLIRPSGATRAIPGTDARPTRGRAPEIVPAERQGSPDAILI
jgi:hypothetical protein